MSVGDRRQRARGHHAGRQIWDGVDFVFSAALSGVAWLIFQIEAAL